MASAEGSLNDIAHTESTEPSLASIKRKRDESVEDKVVNGVHDANNNNNAKAAQLEQNFIRDLIEVLKSEDVTPSILARPIEDASISTEPQSKRQKADEDAGSSITILSRYSSNKYDTVDEILRDIDSAITSIKDAARSHNEGANAPNIAGSEVVLRATAFKNRAHSLVIRERAEQARIRASGSQKSSIHVEEAPVENRTVLTLYGNAPGPRQLFSSFQQPIQRDKQSLKAIQPLRETALPNGIATTQIIPPKSTGVVLSDRTKVKTLGELFPAPTTLTVIHPPKPSKIATTRGNALGWYQPAPKDASPRAPGYVTQNIVAGQWLDYSKSTTPQDPKRRNRERALSLSGPKASLVENETTETEAAKLEALFRSAYSGFAPTKDDSAAVVSEAQINRLWWQKTGEKAYERLLENSENLAEAVDVDMEIVDTLEELDLEKLEKMAEIDPDTIDPSLVPLGGTAEKSAAEKDAEEVLADISDLLETLNSYQRIRHMSLNSARPSGILSTSDVSTVGTPFKPSESEQITYETLKTALKLMIETLPPYAVAKLDPDRLAELSISTKIEIYQEDYKGVMEEDEASARARAALAAAASASRTPAPAPLHRSGSSSQMYGNQYSSQQNSNSQFYRPNQTPVRQPVNNPSRQPATISAPYQARPTAVPSPAYRPNYGTPSYSQQSQQNVRQPPVQYQGASQYAGTNQQYQPSGNSQPYMRPQSQSQTYSQTPQGAPQHSLNGGYPRQGYPPQSQPAHNGLNYQYNPSNLPRQASPNKPYSPQPTAVPPRQYGTPTPTPSHGPSRPPAYLQNNAPQNHLNGTPTQTPQPAYQRPAASGGHMNYSTFMTSAEQTNLLERQRAQLAQQQGMQQQARTAAQAAVGSPSKPSVNGTYQVTAGP